MRPGVLCSCLHPSRSPAALLKAAFLLFSGCTSMQTWSHMPPCSLSLELPFASKTKSVHSGKDPEYKVSYKVWEVVPDQTPGGRCCEPSPWCPSQYRWGSLHTPEPHLSCWGQPAYTKSTQNTYQYFHTWGSQCYTRQQFIFFDSQESLFSIKIFKKKIQASSVDNISDV